MKTQAIQTVIASTAGIEQMAGVMLAATAAALVITMVVVIFRVQD